MKPYSMLDAYEFWKQTNQRRIIPTKFQPLDAALGGGLPVRQITTISAYTGQGKSELARQIARKVMQQGFDVIIIDIELGANRIFERFLIQETHMSGKALAVGIYHDELEKREVEEKIEILAGNPFLKIFSPGNMPPLKKVLETVEESLNQHADHPTLVIFDSVQRLALGMEAASQREAVTMFMGELENFARTHNVAVIAISEMSRAREGGIPTRSKRLTALAEGRAIEYVSDIVMFVVPVNTPNDRKKENVVSDTDEDLSESRPCYICVDKNRVTGREGRLDCTFIFEKPYWGLRVEADNKSELQNQILDFFEKNPGSTTEQCAKSLKRRKEFIVQIVSEFKRLKILKVENRLIFCAREREKKSGNAKMTPKNRMQEIE